MEEAEPNGPRRAREADEVSAFQRRRRVTILAAAAAGLVVLAVAVIIGIAIGSRNDAPPKQADKGAVEFEETLRAPSDDASAKVVGRRTTSGLVLQISTKDLKTLPKRGYYEVFFIAPGNSPRQPNQISAGTFRPDAAGRTDVALHAAVDPSEYPFMIVSAEPSDGNPAFNGQQVLSGSVKIRN